MLRVKAGGKGGLAVPSAKYAELSLAQRMLVAIFVLSGIWYLAWRPGTFNPDALLFSVIVYGAELFGFAAALLYFVTCWRLQRRSPLPVPPTATVAVLVPTINEPVDIVRRTLMAAQRMKHAHEVWLLDDGNRAEMHVLAEELGCRYLARINNRYGKAGNLNNALRHTKAEFIAIFDADHAPAPAFLEETLGFFADDRVAFVQTPLDFYNLDSFQHRVDRGNAQVWNEQTLFFRVIQPGRDRLNSALFCGSCAAVRRKALDDVGGFATGSVAEELHTSIKLHKRGWKSVYYCRSLAFGLAPASAMPFLRQRLRWGQGAMQVWREEGVAFTRGLSLVQRMFYLATVLAYFEGWQRATIFLAPVVVLATGVMPIQSLDAAFLARFIPYYVLAFWVFEEVARGYGRMLLTEQYAMMRFGVFIHATCSYLLRRRRPVVASRQKGKGDGRRPSLWPVYLVLGLNAIAIPVGLTLFWEGRGLPVGALTAALLWASLTAGIAAFGIRFALRTSSSRRREYRFPLPIPLRVQTPRGLALGVATDISSLGCRIAGPPVAGAHGGDELTGELLLPTGPLQVTAMVRTVLADGNTATPVALGCEFRWGLSDERNQLEMFLFGSDLQWRLNGLEERSRTPLERVADLLRGERAARNRLASQHWSPVLYRRVNSELEAGVGFISAPGREGNPRMLVSFGVLPDHGRLFAEELTPDGPRGVVGRVAEEQVLETHAAPIYLYKLAA
jgi:cellulose synthase (UDP-forming)